MDTTGYKPTPVCAACGGKCCRVAPGIVYPADLRAITSDEIYRLLQTGRYAIDHWTEDEDLDWRNTLYLRPRTKNGSMVVPFSEWGGECCFLTDSGCELSFDERPQGCRMLQPGASLDDECNLHGYTKEHGKDAWAPFQEEIKSAIEQCGDVEPGPPGLFDALSAVVNNSFGLCDDLDTIDSI